MPSVLNDPKLDAMLPGLHEASKDEDAAIQQYFWHVPRFSPALEGLNVTENKVANVDPIECTSTQADLVDAHRLHQTVALQGRRFVTRTAGGAAGIGLMVLIVLWRTGIDRVYYSLEAGFFYILLISVSIILQRIIFLPLSIRRQFMQRRISEIP
jgi:hypothetical protein